MYLGVTIICTSVPCQGTPHLLRKQRHLTVTGKNLLINSLSTSLFIFNAQIDIPPVDFIKLVEKQHKEFLWGGTPKIAHNTIIADYKQGGIKYKDINNFLSSINVKFIHSLSSSAVTPFFQTFG